MPWTEQYQRSLSKLTVHKHDDSQGQDKLADLLIRLRILFPNQKGGSRTAEKGQERL